MPSAFRRAAVNKTDDDLVGKDLSTNDTQAIINSSTTSNLTNLSLLRGVRPWQGGSYLTSVGLNDLDTILGGGQPLGTAILLEEDRWMNDLALSLVKYWCAEAVSQGQDLIVPVLDVTDDSDQDNDLFDFLPKESRNVMSNQRRSEIQNLISTLPRNLHWDKTKKQAEKADDGDKNTDDGVKVESKSIAASQHVMLDILEEENDEEEELSDIHKQRDEGLEIAWQYKISVQQQRLGTKTNTPSTQSSTSNVFCHSYDLSGRIIEQENARQLFDSSIHIVDLPSSSKATSIMGENKNKIGMKLFRDLTKLIRDQMIMNQLQHKAIRLLLYHPPLDTLSVALPLLLAHIRKESLPVVVLICTPPTTHTMSWIRLARTSDVVLSTEGFAARKEYPPPAEFRHLQGVLKIAKTTRKLTEIAALIYGFKRDRRKLHIQLLHIPPEDYAENGGSVGAGGVRSGAGRPSKPEESSSLSKSTRKVGTSAGMGCSSNLSGSMLDF